MNHMTQTDAHNVLASENVSRLGMAIQSRDDWLRRAKQDRHNDYSLLIENAERHIMVARAAIAKANGPASSTCNPSSRWPFEQPHVARDLLARLYATVGRVRDAKLEAEIEVFLAATRRP